MDGRFQWGKEPALRDEIVRVGRLMYDRGLVVGNDGNLSARLDEGHVLCTPTGLCKGFMTPDQLIVVDLEGHKVGMSTPANRDALPTSEVLMHLEAYRQRTDVQAVVHAHPPTAVALSIAGISLAECMVPEAIVNLGLIPTTEYSTPASTENVVAIRKVIAGHDGLILQRHGALTVGRSLWEAFARLETLEQVAKITLILHQLGRGAPLAAPQVEKLLLQREKQGLTRPGDRQEFCQLCGVCTFDGRAAQPGRPAQANPEDELVRSVTQAVLHELGYPN
jgi:L-fuculose-phosphate aldolase